MIVIKNTIQSVAKIADELARLNDAKFFSVYEQHYCWSKSNSLPSFAGIWCVKIAFQAAIAAAQDTVLSPDQAEVARAIAVEVRHDANGRPYLNANPPFQPWWQDHQLAVDLSITHTGDVAAATVLLYSIESCACCPIQPMRHRL